MSVKTTFCNFGKVGRTAGETRPEAGVNAALVCDYRNAPMVVKPLR